MDDRQNLRHLPEMYPQISPVRVGRRGRDRRQNGGMKLLLIAVALFWLVVLPPFFTDGACSREFDSELKHIEKDRKAMATLAAAREYWKGRGVPYEVMTADQCRRARSKVIDRCGPGVLVYAAVPVPNLVCRFYRDDEINVQLHFSEKDRLQRVQADMSPYRAIELPLVGKTLYWGK
jgi:hypothetical protein